MLRRAQRNNAEYQTAIEEDTAFVDNKRAAEKEAAKAALKSAKDAARAAKIAEKESSKVAARAAKVAEKVSLAAAGVKRGPKAKKAAP